MGRASLERLIELEREKSRALTQGDAEKVLALCREQGELGVPDGTGDLEVLRTFVLLSRENERRIRNWIEVLTRAVGGPEKGRFFSKTA